MHSNKNKHQNDETDSLNNDNKKNNDIKESNNTDDQLLDNVVLHEKTEVKTYKFSRALSIGGLVVSIILLIVIFIFVYLYFYKIN